MGIVSWEMAESCLCFLLLLLMAGSAGSPGAQQGGGKGEEEEGQPLRGASGAAEGAVSQGKGPKIGP